MNNIYDGGVDDEPPEKGRPPPLHRTPAAIGCPRHNSQRYHRSRWQPLRRQPAADNGLPAWRRALHSLYQHLVTELLLRRKPLAGSKDGRRIPLDLLRRDIEQPLIDERRGHPYISNAIRTSRYTAWDFFPKQLLFQFSRLSNFYFLCVGVPQTIPGISTTGNFTTILPLLFFVLLTVAKEGYDDYKRHRLDNVENARLATLLGRTTDCDGSGRVWLLELERWLVLRRWVKRPKLPSISKCEEAPACGYKWTTRRWKDIKVGDVIRLSRDEDVPADIVLLHADGENSLAYVETMALDGETNLKSKQVPTALRSCDSITGIVTCNAEFVVEDPNPDLYNFYGRVRVDSETLPLTPNEVIYRGCTIRNTPRAIGIVINTGEECKMRRNANRHPKAKRPALERITNKVIVTLAFYVILLSVGCSVGYLAWQKSYEQYAWYLADAAVPFQEIIIGFAIQFNNVIPLAMYVSLEIVKIGQMIMLNSDLGMYDEASDTSARCNTNTILENLGQIGYIFSDKTGTLTENVMKFRKMSIAGTSWLHEMDLHRQQNGNNAQCVVAESKVKESPTSALAEVGGVIPEESAGKTMPISSSPPKPLDMERRSSSHWRSTGRPDHVQPELTTEDLLEYIRRKPHSAFSRKAVQYLLAMALCHTCLPETRDGKTEFQAASPDELALVEAAQDLGFLVVQRSSQTVTLLIKEGDGSKTGRTYEILDVIEFSSKRKRMSIIVRCPDGRIWMLAKGADSAIIPRLKTANLAIQKVNEARKSAELEYELLRRSEQQEPRNSFGGRPSLTIRRSFGLARPSGAPSRLPIPSRSKSFEVSKIRQSGDTAILRPPAVPRTLSLEVPQAVVSRHSSNAQQLPDKYAFLEDPSIGDDSAIFTRCFKHLDDFATEGLRTLLFAHRFLPEQEYNSWQKLYHNATTSLVDRQERIEAAGDIIEQSLDLIGASAIEDKLQKGVPETIDKLRRANIKIWMLTGDKRETAINIAHSARICRPGSDMYILDIAKGDLEAQLMCLAEDLQPQADTMSRGQLHLNHSVVVIDGHTLAAIEDPAAPFALRHRFFTIVPKVDSVICCRASPAQKALLVRAIRKACSSPPNTSAASVFWAGFSGRTPPLTLAIGDGANDLAMLAEAHVGVGISGREGLQAARVADYAIAQFRFLARLLLVHGRHNYARTAAFILWTFWKEMFFYLPTALYQRYNGYTGTSLYESWSLTVLNTLFTSLCVVVPGVWEMDLAPLTLLAVPELYVYGQRDAGLNAGKYIWWMTGAAVEGVLVWFGCWAGYGAFAQAVDDAGLFAVGDLAFTTCILWTNWKLFIIETHHKSAIVLVSCAVTISGWWAWNGFLSSVYGPGVNPYSVRDGFSTTFGRDLTWWAALGAILGVLLILEVGYKAARRAFIVRGWPWGSLAGLWMGFRGLCCCSWIRRRNNRPGKWRDDAGAAPGLRGSAEEWDLELWQEMEKDPAVKEMLVAMAREGTSGSESEHSR